jgi:NAD(P)-dependent dehydrogenase (short-subunit alcohol dehydrogenase family)
MSQYVSDGKAIVGAQLTAKQVMDQFGEGDYLKGKTAIVTGGNSGIGLETCKALASAGARVILCSRSLKAGESAVKEEIEKKGLGGYAVDSSNIIVKALDLNTLSSIKAFADDFIATEGRVDLLVLNAGIMALPKLTRTESGFESQIGVNHFGHVYLTRLLLPMMLKDGTSGRIAVLASSAHSQGRPNPDDLSFHKQPNKYSGWNAYGKSKSANILFAKSLADKLSGTQLTAVSVHPGVIQTALWRQSLFNKVVGYFIASKTVPQGAATTVYACVCPKIDTPGMRGDYLADCASCGVITDYCRDEKGDLREALWQATETELQAAVSAAGLGTLPEMPHA